MGGRTYPVRYYPIAIWLRDRKGRAILCSHYFLSVGTLRVLHSECVPSHSFTLTHNIVLEDWIEKWDGKMPQIQGSNNMMPMINFTK